MTASAPSPAFESPVERVTETPPTVSVVVAWTVETPAVGETRLTVQAPAAVVHLPSAGVNVPGPLGTENVTVVPSGAFTKPPPVFTVTAAVKTCGLPTSFVAVNGVTTIRASTAFDDSFAALQAPSAAR